MERFYFCERNTLSRGAGGGKWRSIGDGAERVEKRGRAF
jgi:hypothetical protein